MQDTETIERSKKLGVQEMGDQAAHVFDLKGQSQTRTYSMPNLDFRPRLFKRWIALPPG